METKYDSYKDFGIAWVGDIPSHWGTSSLKYVVDLFTGNSLNNTLKERYAKQKTGYTYVSTKDLDIDTQKIEYRTEYKIPFEESNFKIAPTNSTLICIEGGSAGKKIAYNTKEIAFVNKLCCIKSKAITNNKFIFYYCNSNIFKDFFNSYISSLIGGVSISFMKDFPIIPPLDEQQRIANYLLVIVYS